MTRFPRPLAPGARIGVTSPSSGVGDRLRPRIEASIASLRDRGFEVVVGECMADEQVVSAPKEQRAAELVSMLTDPAIAAVVPPWGGETAIDLLDQVDWDALRDVEPTWVVGWSDMCSVLLPLTLRAGWATLHGWNLADTAYAAPDGLAALARPGRRDRRGDADQSRAHPGRAGTTTRPTPTSPR